MDSLSYKTKLENKQTVEKKWFVVDAKGATLGRMSSEIAKILRGKNKPSFTPHVDCGDNVIVINAEGIVLTGNKMNEKEYITFSGYPGGQRKATARQLTEKMKRISHERNGVTLERNGLVEKAVRGMLPKTILGRAVIKNLFVYQGENHPHEAQKPTKINF